jgi:hypothetical protein
MADNFYGFEDEGAEEKGGDNLFLWTIFILLLIGVAAGCWIGSFYVFGKPEDPRFYKFLRKLGKIDPPKRFEVTAAPPGKFQSAKDLFDKYSAYTPLMLKEENDELLRNYLKNYRETKKLTPYITGHFTIMDAYELKKGDMFPSGIVALAQSVDFPQVLIEHAYPAIKDQVTAGRTMLQTGFPITIERTNDLSAIIHIEKIADGKMQFTLVPLLYGTYALKRGVGTFSLEPPAELDMSGGVPLTKPAIFKNALAKYAMYKRGLPATDTAAADAAPPAAGPEVVRVDVVEPGTKVPETGAMPTVAIATPVPIPGRATPRPALAVQPTPTPRIAVAMLNTPTPRPIATPIAVAPPMFVAPPSPVAPPPVAPPQVSPSGVPLKPFIASAPAPGTMPSAPGATWRTYQAGRAPAGRGISPVEATTLAGRGDLGEKLYLQGDFRVTASGENRAVLRDKSAGADPANPSPVDSVRIIVEYPAGAVPPGENATFTRDGSRPFEIRDIRKGADGQVNIYVREIMAQP